MLTKNQAGQYPEFFDRYVSQLPNHTDVFEILAVQPQQLSELLQHVTEENADKGYAPGKWSIKEVIGHLIDSDRIFAYRCLCISRRETQPLPGFDENTYVEFGNFNSRTLSHLLEEFGMARQSNLALFNSLDEEMLNQTGIASNNTLSAKALVVITAAHALHHIKILEERYLNKVIPA